MRFLFLLLFFSGCSLLGGEDAPPPPQKLTKFLEHPELCKPRRERFPFMVVWTVDEAKFLAAKERNKKIAVLPVDLSYFEIEDDSAPIEDRAEIAEYMRGQFHEALQSEHMREFAVVDNEGPGTFVVKLALIKLGRTAVLGNIASDVAGFFIPGSQVVSTALSMTGGAVVREFSSGRIAIAMKFLDGENNELLGEFFDERGDRSALLVNTGDYSEYGNAKINIDDWSEEFIELLSTPLQTKVEGPSKLALFLW